MTKNFNIILITLDGLRVDRLDLCPNLMTISKKNIFLPNIITAIPFTLAALHSIHSGLSPSRNGVNSHYHMFKFKKEKIKTLAQYLKEAGYYTFTDILNDCLLPKQGFDEVQTHKIGEDMLSLHQKAISKLSAKDKFFAYFQYSPIHDVYAPYAKKYDQAEDEYFNNQEKNKELYNTQVIECDNYVQNLMKYLQTSGLLAKTLLILHSDHGVSNGEKKGEKLYSSFVYDYTIKTFCTIILPNNQNVQIDWQGSTLDIMPTILDLAGIEKDENFKRLEGRSLMRFVDGTEQEDRIAFCETGGLFGLWPSREKPNVFCVRYQDKKIIYNQTPKSWEFYDLKQDPKENNNLIDQELAEIKEYKKLLLEKLKENGISYP